MSFPGLTNHVVPVPDSDVICYLGVRDSSPSEWAYSLWTDDDETCLAIGSLDLTGLSVTPQQVARVAFLLEVDYAD